MVLNIFSPFHLGLVLAVSGKFYGSLREEVADEAKKTRLGFSLLPVPDPTPRSSQAGGKGLVGAHENGAVTHPGPPR